MVPVTPVSPVTHCRHSHVPQLTPWHHVCQPRRAHCRCPIKNADLPPPLRGGCSPSVPPLPLRYELSPGDGGVFTKTTMCNGKRLPSAIADGKPINDIPVPGIKGDGGFAVPPFGIVFLVKPK